ncbi:MAG: Eco57I restriction-modification methylase domain-containing protein [Dehalococcoidia bacterium]|nr:Eco57I restriction-modification methylase domain-containing protein [Dehalococcoidia bacterium]
MTQEGIGKRQDQMGQTSTWFQNRGLFSDHFLQARLPEWGEWKVDAEMVPFRESLVSLYESKKPRLPYLKEAQTEDEFIKPVLDLLGYTDSYIVQAPTKVGQHTNRPDYALFPDVKTKNMAYQKLDQNDYSLCIGIADAKYWERELDLAKSSERDMFTNRNPSFQIAGYLTGTKQNWGILTNGRLWRLYSAKSNLPLGNYYQVDLVQLLEEAPVETLKYFYVFFRKQGLLQIDGKSFLDRVLEGSDEYTVELEGDIKERAYDVVERLCRGFAADFTHEQLTDATLKSIYDNSLTLLYRLLFVFYAEARELLPLTSNASYRENYSLRRLAHDIDEIFKKGYAPSASSTQYYDYISNLFQSINNGDSELGVPEYNGGLFDPTEHPFLERHAIPDAYLVRAIHHLARITDKELGREVAVDYNTLSERHLGSIYEGLLEFKPLIAPHDLVVIKDKGRTRYAPAAKYPGKQVAYKKDELYLANDKGERKASGSYYTPEYIVNYIVENTLDPLAKEAHDKVKALRPKVDKAIEEWGRLKEQKQGLEPTEKYDRKMAEESDRLLEPYLSLKVLDPAMGSGHFLARATDFLAEAIATDPDIESPLELTEESELTYYRRRVVESCIYGVDLNPLAVELAKLTLWLTTMAKSKPLSFLNHHLRVGNSLIGARVADLDEIPKAKGKKQSFDLSRAPVQLGLFQEALNKKLYDLLQNRALIAQLPTETLEDVHNKQKWEKDFEHNMERFRALADVWVSTFLGNKVPWDEYNTLVENLQSPDPEWEKLLEKKYVQSALDLREHYRLFHWELEFPEVFYSEDGNRKANAGFDTVIGNPPWGGLLDDNILEFLSQFFAARGWNDSYAFFMQMGTSLCRRYGLSSMIVPSSWLTVGIYRKVREYMLDKGGFATICYLYRVFDDVNLDEAMFIHKKNGGGQETSVVFVAPSDLSPKSRLKRLESSGWSRSFSVPNSAWAQDSESRIDVLADPLRKQTITKIWATSIQLQRAFRIGIGIQAYCRPKHTPEEIRRRIYHSKAKLSETYLPCLSGNDVGRYEIHLEEAEFLSVGPWLYFVPETEILNEPRILVQQVVWKTLKACLVTQSSVAHYNSIFHIWAPHEAYELGFVLGLLNSKFIAWVFPLLSNKTFGDKFPKLSHGDLSTLPIRRINFTTAEEERKQLLEQAKELYEEHLHSHNRDKVLTFVAERLPIKEDGTPDMEHEQSDVVHDLLAFLAEEMTRLNKEKQSKTKDFLTWLEKEVLRGSIDDQKNKTKIKKFHEGTL